MHADRAAVAASSAATAAGGGREELTVAGVSKAYGRGVDRSIVLDGIDLRVGRGQFVSVIGPSGCGKSTLLRIVAGLVSADSGAVSIFGETVRDAAAAKHIGFVPQSPALLPWRTALQNVQLPLQVNRRPEPLPVSRDPVRMLQAFGLGGVLHRRPAQLSRGQQQRVAIARALAFDPTVLLMDEPFAALDELTREQQRHELLEVWQADRKTVVFVTHSVAEAITLSDLVVVMAGPPGRVHCVVPVAFGRPRGEGVELSAEFRETEAALRAALRAAWQTGG